MIRTIRQIRGDMRCVTYSARSEEVIQEGDACKALFTPLRIRQRYSGGVKVHKYHKCSEITLPGLIRLDSFPG